ncbi:hypothetical protein MHBO_003927, partial [Bonamia ostreae]
SKLMNKLLVLIILLFRYVYPYPLVILVSEQKVTYCAHLGDKEKSKTTISKFVGEANVFSQRHFDYIVILGEFQFYNENSAESNNNANCDKPGNLENLLNVKNRKVKDTENIKDRLVAIFATSSNKGHYHFFPNVDTEEYVMAYQITKYLEKTLLASVGKVAGAPVISKTTLNYLMADVDSDQPILVSKETNFAINNFFRLLRDRKPSLPFVRVLRGTDYVLTESKYFIPAIASTLGVIIIAAFTVVLQLFLNK